MNERKKEREKRRDVYRRTEEHVYVEHIEPHIGHLRENKKKKVSGNNVTSVDANTPKLCFEIEPVAPSFV